MIEQHELPGREPLETHVLHARRERVFLPLASLVIAAMAMLPLLGLGRLFGVTSLVQRVGLEPPATLLLPIGALAMPIGMLALGLVVDLLGRGRARALLFALVVVWLGVLGLHWATDHVPAYDATTTATFAPALALVACGLVACVVQIESQRFVGRIVAPILGVAGGWGVFALIASRLGIDASGIALAAGGYSVLAVIAGLVPGLLLVRVLATYVRVELRRKRREIFDDEPLEPAFLGRATPVPTKRAFTSDEMEFFDAGDVASRDSRR